MKPEEKTGLLRQLAGVVPHYQPTEVLGQGGYGYVVAARHRDTGRDVAVKILRHGLPIESFLREADILVQLREHPHVVNVSHYIERGGLAMIFMDRMAGSLRRPARTVLPAVDACVVAIAVAQALSAAHCLGVLHRDIKPDNVLLSKNGTPRVADFGIAKMFEGTRVAGSQPIGTPRYMAPEQWATADDLGPGTDLYALGVLFYELLEGQHPLGAHASLPAWMHAHLQIPPAAPTRTRGALADVVLSTLAKDRRKRPASAAEFVTRLAMTANDVLGPGWWGTSRFHLSPDRALRQVLDQ